MLFPGTHGILYGRSGRECKTGLETAQLLEQNGVAASIVNPRSLKPFDVEKLKQDAADKVIA